MKESIIASLLWIAICIAALVGEVKCVIKIFECDFEPSYKAEVLYTASALTGIGCVVGYFDLGK